MLALRGISLSGLWEEFTAFHIREDLHQLYGQEAANADSYQLCSRLTARSTDCALFEVREMVIGTGTACSISTNHWKGSWPLLVSGKTNGNACARLRKMVIE